jgi:UDP-3-O-[3-hydroxymyristoyl] N-acetylglucosamine deacetylase
MHYQNTLKKEFKISGVGLHTGKNINVFVKPAATGTGIVFFRTDKNIEIKAKYKNVVKTDFSTVIGSKDGVTISTVEHLMAALKAFNIDNAAIYLDGPELPIMDGSAKAFCDKIMKAGVLEQDKKRKYLQIVKPISYRQNDRFIYFLPSKTFKITCRVNYKHPRIGIEHLEYSENKASFVSKISSAKTFGFLDEVKNLKDKGLILGASKLNAIVLDGKKVINKDMMTYKDEFVRHKILDIIGDMALLNEKLICHIVSYKSGHGIHNMALKELMKRKNCFKIVEEPIRISEKVSKEKILRLLDPVKVFK